MHDSKGHSTWLSNGLNSKAWSLLYQNFCWTEEVIFPTSICWWKKAGEVDERLTWLEYSLGRRMVVAKIFIVMLECPRKTGQGKCQRTRTDQWYTCEYYLRGNLWLEGSCTVLFNFLSVGNQRSKAMKFKIDWENTFLKYQEVESEQSWKDIVPPTLLFF